MTYPSFEEILAGENPDRLYVTKRSLLSIFPRVLLFLSLCGFVVYVNFSFGTDSNANMLRLVSLLPIGVLLDIIRVHFNDLYVFARYKVIRHKGRISFQYSVPSINYTDIRGIVVSQSFIGRILNYGDVLLGTAAYDGHELVIEGVENPYELAEIIESFRKKNQSTVSDE